MLPWVVLGVAVSKRTRELRASCEHWGFPAARVVEWSDWLRRPETLEDALAAPCVFKLEPPGDDPWVHHHLMALGAARLGKPAPAVLQHGELGGGRSWFEGFRIVMQRLNSLLACRPEVLAVNAPADIMAMTDKLDCQRRLQARGLTIPHLFGPVSSHEELLGMMDHHGLDRAFVKARFGSSAAGVVAFRRTRRGQQQATTTAHLVEVAGQSRLFNVKRVSRYERPAEIAKVVDLIAEQGSYVEAWLSKPRAGHGHFDLRVLAIQGRAAHRVARVSEHTMTNLHLDARRVEPAHLLSEVDLQQVEAAVAQAAAAFAGSSVIGFAVVPHRLGPHVLEANAFGDLLPGLQWQGQDAHAALVSAQAASQG